MKFKTIPAYSGNTSLMPIPTCELRNHHCPRGEHFHLRLSYMTNVPFLNSSSIFNSPSSLSLSSTFWELSLNLMHPRFSEISILIFSSFFLSFIQLLGIYIIIVPPFFALHTPKYYYILSVNYPKVSRSLFLLLILIQPLGSLPPTRGTHTVYFILSPFLRITHAYAWNTFTIARRPVIPWDHPCLRGEYRGQKEGDIRKWGSPPPTRGILLKMSKWLEIGRITPAYAGNTMAKCPLNQFQKDHPRLRGEYYNMEWQPVYGQGSPPPTRGIPIERPKATPEMGITPAYAGNTTQGYNKVCSVQDHPRLRGEYYTSLFIASIISGSPPPTRGIQALCRHSRC